jgi:hypothetical protein
MCINLELYNARILLSIVYHNLLVYFLIITCMINFSLILFEL